MSNDHDAHVITYANYLWREYLNWKISRDNHKFWLKNKQ